MAHSSVQLMIVFGLVLIWICGLVTSCGFLEFNPDPPVKALLQNDSHFGEEMYRSAQASFYGCVELCKVTNGCTRVNFETDSTTCVLYSTSGIPTFETNAGDWLYVKIADTTFTTSTAPCDPTGCEIGQYCRSIQGSPTCLYLPS